MIDVQAATLVWRDRLDALRRLGPIWLARRVVHEIDSRTGLVRRRTPRHGWQLDGEDQPPDLRLVDCDALANWLRPNTSDARRSELERRTAQLAKGQATIFGTEQDIRDWHRDPLTGAPYDQHAHWSLVGELAGCDLKCVWEPSRFGWAFDLVRLHLLEPDSEASTTFWDLFVDWMDANPPNTGVQWSCGQESSVRLLAVTLAMQGMADAVPVGGWARFNEFTRVTASRVIEHLAYARSQRNNHLSSEAMGLALAAALLPDDPDAARWSSAADRAFRDVAQHLIFADGGSSQYSTNYHRVFVQALAMRELIALRSGTGPTSSRPALDRAATYLEAQVLGPSGEAAFHGHDDGADLLPLAALEHRSLAGTVELVAALLGSPSPGIPAAEEASRWFGLDSLALVPAPSPAGWASFPQAGVHKATRGEMTIVARAGGYRFRPAHADQLDVEIWFEGRPVTVDRGTYAYTADMDGADRFAQSWHHNTVVLDGEDHMVRVGRFLWARWSEGTLASTDVLGGRREVELVARIGRSGRRATRRIEMTDEVVQVIDTVEGPNDWAIAWQLAEARPLDLVREPDDSVDAACRRAIGYRETASDVTVVVRRPTNGRVVSEFRRTT
ncbi:MAG: heparinase II/III family protein [Actinomycetota bacterium]